MNKYITKTIYLEALACEKNTWLKLHRPELVDLFELSDFEKSLMNQGNIVELWARKKYPEAIFIEGSNALMADLTKSHIENKMPVLFQATFIFDKFLIRSDILEYDKSADQWNLYEVKGKNSVEENSSEIDHLEDATFQSIIIQNSGIKLGKVTIIHLNKEYVRNGDIDINELFIEENITEKVKCRLESTKLKMENIKNSLLQGNEELLVCKCIYKGRSAHCPTFKYSHNYVPLYSVHDLARIGNSKKKLEDLINKKIYNLMEIPKDFELSKIQQKQVNSYIKNQPFIDIELIKNELKDLKYPLYFLDYESYASAIPIFNGYRPYQQIIFQFSLHVLEHKNRKPLHFEYLHELDSDPSLIIIQKLMEFIGDTGSIIVWTKSFEKTRNIELAQLHPKYKEFLDNVNNRLYDLEDIFKKQLYVHSEFKGKTSLKNILPVLVPELSYKELEIQQGQTASLKWSNMLQGNLTIEEKEKVFKDLKQYCSQDTYAMYKIWKFLDELKLKLEKQIDVIGWEISQLYKFIFAVDELKIQINENFDVYKKYYEFFDLTWRAYYDQLIFGFSRLQDNHKDALSIINILNKNINNTNNTAKSFQQEKDILDQIEKMDISDKIKTIRDKLGRAHLDPKVSIDTKKQKKIYEENKTEINEFLEYLKLLTTALEIITYRLDIPIWFLPPETAIRQEIRDLFQILSNNK